MLASQFPKIDVAAAYQHVLEVVAAAYVAHYLQKTGIKNLVLSGGVVANVKLNQRLREIPGVEEIFVHPNMGDGGCGTGAALLEFAAARALPHAGITDVYWGPSYSDERDRRRAAAGRSCRSTSYTPIEPKIAQLIAAGKVVAPLQRADGVRPARARQPLDPLPRQGARGEPVAQPAARPHGVHAVRAGHAGRASRRLLQERDGGEYAAQFMTLDVRLHRADEAGLARRRSTWTARPGRSS